MPSAPSAPASPSHGAPPRATPPSYSTAPPVAAPSHATDDEILGLPSPRRIPHRDPRQLEFDFDSAFDGACTDASPVGARHAVPERDAWQSSGHSTRAVIPSEASAVSSSEPEPPVRADAPSRNVSRNDAHSTLSSSATTAEPAHLRAAFDANPELRAVWRDATAYRESFPTPDAARAATALLADLNHMDALFFSRRPEDHAALASAIAGLDPAAFASLANAMNSIAAGSAAQPMLSTAPPAGGPVPQATNSAIALPRQAHANADEVHTAGVLPASLSFPAVGARHAMPERGAWQASAPASTASSRPRADLLPDEGSGVSSANDNQVQISHSARNDEAARDANSATSTESQLAFLHSANASAVEGVIGAIESQVERLLPEGMAKSARNRVVGEIYRELDSTLRSNPEFAAQMRDAFRSGSLDDAHQRAIVSLLTSRARQALPAVAKRVLGEWTSTLVSANAQRRARQRSAEHRVDIAGSGGAANDGRRSMAPRDLDYSRLTDADILNL